MTKETTYTIGEFAEKTGTSIRTLHYYDEIGLLTPQKQASSGHRIYDDQDVLTLQKIVSLKFLGYRLEDISRLMKESSFDLSLVETLRLQKAAFEEKKEQIETSLKAIQRIISLVEEEGEVDSAILMSLIHSIQTEKQQMNWLGQHIPTEVIEHLSKKSEEELVGLDKHSIHYAKEVKRLMRLGKPAHDPEVQALVEQHLNTTFTFLGEEAMESLSQLRATSLENINLEELEAMFPSPFTKEEDEWMQQAIEYYIQQHGMNDKKDLQ